jgi:TRAP-type C4-dicarboxylate transport system substrate-binding protein
VTVVLCALALTGGCSSSGGGDKSGGPDAPTVLVLASNDGVNLDGAPAVQRFVDQVRELSRGRLTVRVEPSWAGGSNEPRVIKDVAAGKADLGWAGTRAFDLLGVDSFRPLHAPFLVDSYALEAAIVRDPLGHQLLAGIEPTGVTPLALAADELRFPAATAKPLLSPADWQGRSFRTAGSRSQADAIDALGAKPVLDGDLTNQIQSGAIDGLETMWWTYQANSLHELSPFVTANARLWPRTLVIFASPASLRHLDGEQRGWVTQAASDAAQWSTEHAGDGEPAQMADACAKGARVAVASSQQLATLRRAAQPVYAALRANPTSAATLARIEALKASTPPPGDPSLPAGCRYQPGEEKKTPPRPVTRTAPGPTGAFPVGTYRYTLTMKDLLAEGVPEQDAVNNAGVWTWTMGRGVWDLVWRPSQPGADPAYPCKGNYTAHDDVVSFTRTLNQPHGQCVPPTWTARWSRSGARISWSAIDVAGFAIFFGHKPWEKIG